jgi:hypothetical protein
MPFADKIVRAHLLLLARKGCLIAQAFDAFRQVVYPGASEDQIRELRIAFFAGAAEIHAIQMAALDEGEDATDADMAFMEGWVSEITEFHEKTLAAAGARGTKRPS